MRELYNVEVFTPNKMFNIKGKLVRSPVKFIVDEDELVKIKMQIEIQGVLNYDINPQNAGLNKIIPKNKENELIEETILDEEVEVENFNKEETILDSLLKITTEG